MGKEREQMRILKELELNVTYLSPIEGDTQ